MQSTAAGSLSVVGIGIQLGAHATHQALARIACADIVFAAAGNGLSEAWVRAQNPHTVSLQSCYGLGDRARAYDKMVEMILAAVRAGQQVCAVFYGHPGVFVTPSHRAVARARAEGFAAEMFPAISAEDCLYADLDVDPGFGRQSYEARDFYLRGPRIDTGAALILWQIAVMDDASFCRLESSPETLALLRRKLLGDYPPEHEVVIYEAATLVGFKPSIERIRLGELTKARVSQVSTLYAPPRIPQRA